MRTPVTGSRWQRRPPGREVVEVRRAWDWPGQGPTVRAHPVRGGRPLIASTEWFLENYEPLEALAAGSDAG